MATGRLPDPNTAPVTAKGDLYTYSTVPAKLAVGNNGETLVADSSATTGLRWQGNFAAGKNAIINGDFRINQRSFSSTTTSATYGFDRWTTFIAGDGTCTYSAQTFTAGAAPVAGYEAINFARLLTASQTSTAVASRLEQPIEDVRTYANQTVTISFWAKAASATPKIAVEMTQGFGSGGSTSVNTYAGQVTLSTSWARYSVTVAIPSISGKTIGTGSSLITRLYVSAGSDFNARTGSIGIQNNTFDIWGVQVEAGSVATAFQTATGTLAGELAACQRYYVRFNAATAYQKFGEGVASSTTAAYIAMPLPVEMRVVPTAIDASAANTFRLQNHQNFELSTIAIGTIPTGKSHGTIAPTVASGLTAGGFYFLMADNDTTAYLGFTAEL